MKTIVLIAGLILCSLCLLNGASAVPVGSDDSELMTLNAGADAEHLVTLNRQKRFTCNVLKSPPACFAHCLALGKIRGGYCRNGTCICRQ
ncbi:defensin-A-like [Ceratitis capitata]|uniref:defensin-A-like n=1 Tax=Ceratitis capitata TaxID=7213 RepID=UPI00032A2EBF|nr:defensin-A-like [Ceratitis capitata]